jgi:hypothetical protein
MKNHASWLHSAPLDLTWLDSSTELDLTGLWRCATKGAPSCPQSNSANCGLKTLQRESMFQNRNELLGGWEELGFSWLDSMTQRLECSNSRWLEDSRTGGLKDSQELKDTKTGGLEDWRTGGLEDWRSRGLAEKSLARVDLTRGLACSRTRTLEDSKTWEDWRTCGLNNSTTWQLEDLRTRRLGDSRRLEPCNDSSWLEATFVETSKIQNSKTAKEHDDPR